MKKRYTDKEIKDILKNMTIIADTREQVWDHVAAVFEKLKCPVARTGLTFGDYTCMLEMDGQKYSFEDEIRVERKASLDEIAGNFTAERERFEREFLKAKAHGTKMFLVIENGSWADIEAHNYISRMAPKSLSASLLSWQVRYNLTVVFCRPSDTGKIIYCTFYYYLMERLKNGGLL